MQDAGVYLRVSTEDQDEENQRADAVMMCKARGWNPVFYIEHGLSGSTTERRLEYQRMMKDARRGKLRAVVVWKLDRLGRSVKQLVVDFDNLSAWGCDLVSVRDPIDTTTAFGKAMFQLAAVFAELERNQISDRTKASYRTKAARAANLGQKVKWGREAADVPREAVLMARSGASARSISSTLGISRRLAGYAVALVARNGGVVEGDPAPPEAVGGTESTDYVPAVGA